jgi:light-regulated signal transduction histidine kinase (bacteriophytochrome)
LEFLPTDLDEILKGVLNELDLQIKSSGAIIIYDHALPKVSAIHLQMAQLFHNLLTNSLKYRKEEIPPVIHITAASLSESEIKLFPFLVENKDHIKIIISDNGIGFDEQFAEQIFQIFERLHSADEYDGTGVGLALCKKIVENHGGHIFATSEDGEGASLTIILPVNH